jgi:hypothetical protein
LLLVTTTLSVFKPWGLTSYGRRAQPMPAVVRGPSLGLKIAIVIIGLIATAFVLLHLSGHGLHHGM